MNFSKFKLDPRLISAVEALGYKEPTPIQAKAIPLVLEGLDVIGLAQTGTGKTAAFALPLLNKLLDGPRGRLRALIIVPTRELAEQIQDSIREFAKGTGLRSVTLYGGVNLMKQFQTLRRGVDIAIACPGRLLDHIGRRNIDLSQVQSLVLDEADQMFDFGFGDKIREIITYLPKKRQSLLFSATMPKPILALAAEILTNPVPVQIGELAPAKSVTQKLYQVTESLKTELLIKILQTVETESVLIFTRTKHRAKKLAEQLEALGYSATSFQGNLSQGRRQLALNQFRNGKLKILVATDIAARGIDVQNVSHVINFDMPATTEAYTHRIGRTGRASKLGAAFTLITNSDRHQVRSIERKLNQSLERCIISDFDYRAAANADTLGMDDDERPRQNHRRQSYAPRAQQEPRKKFGSGGGGSSAASKPRRSSESGSYAGQSSSTASKPRRSSESAAHGPKSTAFKKSSKPYYAKFKSNRKKSRDGSA